MTGEAYAQSAVVARDHGGPFNEYKKNEQPFLRVIKKHRSAAYAIPESDAPRELIDAARSSWDSALELGTQFGYRNAQVTVLAPTGTIAFMMDCDTTGIEPDIALIKYKKLVGEGFLKIVNKTVPAALKKLGYTPTQVEEIVKYIDERETIEGAPAPQARAPVRLRLRLQAGQRRALHPLHGPRPDDGRDPAVPLWRDQQDRQHARGGDRGGHRRRLHGGLEARPQGHRDLSGWVEALAAALDGQEEGQGATSCETRRTAAAPMQAGLAGEPKPYRRRLPDERRAITHKFQVAGHEGYITVGLYPDGQPGEIFLKMAKEGSHGQRPDGLAGDDDLDRRSSTACRCATWSTSSPTCASSRPASPATAEIPIAKSIVDYVFRWMGSRFLSKDERDALGIITREETLGVAGSLEAVLRLRGWLCQPGCSGVGSFRRLRNEALCPWCCFQWVGLGEYLTRQTSGSLVGPKRQRSPRSTRVGAARRPAPVLGNGHANGNGNGHAVSSLPIKPIELGGGTKVAFSVSADSPSCADCGSIMVRNGSCYKCLNCGSTSGCS